MVVMVAVMITVLLAAVTLRFMLAQGRLDRHQINRIRAFYAAQAGMAYAMEMLRNGDWLVGGADQVFCFNDAACPGVDVYDDPDIFFPVRITIHTRGEGPSTHPEVAPVTVFVDYNVPNL